KKNEEDRRAAIRADVRRRGPHYATIFAASTSGFPLDIAGPFTAVDMQKTGHPMIPFFAFPPNLPLEAVQREMGDMLGRRAAEEKAQQNMQIVRAALEKADGDAEKFKRELNKYVKELNLVYGPDNKGVYVNR